MLDAEGNIKIIDFGLSTVLQKNQLAQTYVGTCEYQAPEIVLRQEYERSVDFWSLGIVIYEMLFSTTPFFDQNVHKVHRNILNNRVLFRRDLVIGKSREVFDLMDRLL